MARSIEVTLVDGTKRQVMMTLPVQPAESESGKSIVIASTHGNRPTTVAFDGQPLVLGLNAYYIKQ